MKDERLGVDEELTPNEHAFVVALWKFMEPGTRPDCVRAEWVRSNPRFSGLDDPLFFGMHVDAPSLALMTIGAYLEGNRIRGDQLDDQNYTFPATPTRMALDVSGSPEQLAAHTADWFNTIVHRTVVRYEWLHRKKVYATLYLFPDTGECLSSSYNKLLAPRGQADRLTAAGHSNNGWIDVKALEQPNRILHVRGDAV